MTTAVATGIANVLTDQGSAEHGITDEHWRSAFQAAGGIEEIARGGDVWAETQVGDQVRDFQFTGALDDEATYFVRGWVYPTRQRRGVHETDTMTLLSCAYFSIDHQIPGYAAIVRAFEAMAAAA